jgi:hypothetical protein
MDKALLVRRHAYISDGMSIDILDVTYPSHQSLADVKLMEMLKYL